MHDFARSIEQSGGTDAHDPSGQDYSFIKAEQTLDGTTYIDGVATSGGDKAVRVRRVRCLGEADVAIDLALDASAGSTYCLDVEESS